MESSKGINTNEMEILIFYPEIISEFLNTKSLFKFIFIIYRKNYKCNFVWKYT